MGSTPSAVKAMKTLSRYEEAGNEAFIGIRLKKKLVDGQVKVLACIDGGYGPEPSTMDAQQPMQEEWSDMEKVTSMVGDILRAKAKALS